MLLISYLGRVCNHAIVRLQGLPDLCKGVIRTPLAPDETFRDDPLRVVRCVRFASRFGFDMVPELQYAVQLPVIKVTPASLLFQQIVELKDLQEALSSKVSRERIGEEIDKMMNGSPSPTRMKKVTPHSFHVQDATLFAQYK